MRSFKKFVVESIEQAELDEAIEVRHDRYMRSHGKKASGGTGSWMFTHKAMGDVDHKNEKEVYSAPSGKFSDAKKAAQQWAKKHGHSTVYVMESVELDEARKSDSYQFTHKPGDAESEKRLADLKKSVKGTGKRVVLQGRLGKDNPNAHKYSKDAPSAKYKDGKRVNSDVSGKSGGHSHQRIQKADAAHHDVYVYDRNESVELDEVSDKMLDRYRQKAFADQPSGDDGSNKYRKRKFGRDLAFDKQTGRAKVLATKEEVELAEADLRITKVYNKFPKKATYAVHSSDRKYYKEFDSMEAAKAHHAEKTGK
jgi:hypothetical protein